MGLGMVLSHVLHSTARPDTRFWPIAWLFIRIAWFLIVIHFVEIVVWALFFWWEECLPDLSRVLFFWCDLRHDRLRRLATAKEWRIYGPVEAIDWQSDVRAVDGIFLCYREQKRSSTHGRS